MSDSQNSQAAVATEPTKPAGNNTLLIVIGILLAICCCVIVVVGGILLSTGALVMTGVNELDKAFRDETGLGFTELLNEAQKLEEKANSGEDVGFGDLFGAVGESELPKNLPKDVPLYSGDYKVKYTSESEDSSSKSMSFTLEISDKNVSGVVDVYKDLLSRNGWDINSQSSFGGVSSFDARKDDGNRNLSLTIMQGGLLTASNTVSVTYSYTEYR